MTTPATRPPIDRSTDRDEGSPALARLGRRVTPEGSPLLGRLFPEPVAAKVPEITTIFWVVKILTTAGGEVTSDSLATLGNIAGGGIEVLLLVVGIAAQFRSRRYNAVAYWLLAYGVATVGTGISDFLHLDVGIPYVGTTTLWAVVLVVVLVTWHRSEGTLSIHSITTQRRECFYWATVFATFALGTALGDFTATSLGLGYLSSTILFFLVILVPWVLWRQFGLNEVVAFWAAYIVTRPLGASIADYVSKPHAISGADLGNPQTALLALACTVVLVAYLAVARPDIQGRTLAPSPVGPLPPPEENQDEMAPLRHQRAPNWVMADPRPQSGRRAQSQEQHQVVYRPPGASTFPHEQVPAPEENHVAYSVPEPPAPGPGFAGSPEPAPAPAPPAPEAGSSSRPDPLARLREMRVPDPEPEPVRRPEIEHFDPMLRDLLAWDLVERVETSEGPVWQLVAEAQKRMDRLDRSTGTVEPERIVYFDHRCADCHTRQRTRLRDGLYLCESCLEARSAEWRSPGIP